MIGLITLPISLIPLLAGEFTGLNLDLQLVLQKAQTWMGKPIIVAGQTIDPTDLLNQGVSAIQNILEPVFGHTLGLAVDVITSIVWIIFIFVVSFYLVKDGQTLREWVEKLVPPIYRSDFITLRDHINKIWGAFFRGQIILSLVVSAIFTLAGLVLGLPFAFAMGVAAGLLEFLPSIGHGIWLALASLLALSLGSTWIPVPSWVFALIIVALHLVYQQFDLNYLIPRIIGHSVHLPPLVVILGIVAGAVFAGMLGIPLAAPTIASARVIGRYIYANLFDLDPFPEIIAPPLPPPDPNWWRPGRSKESVPIQKSINEP